MLEIIISIIFAFLIVLLVTPVVREMAKLIGAMANKNHRTIHRGAIPKLGGIAVYMGFLGGIVLLYAFSAVPLQEIRGVFGILVGATLMLIVGIADDVRELSCYEKFAIQIFGAVLATFFGMHISSISLPFIGTVNLGIISVPLTVLWIVGIVNAINLIDGLDGLAVGIALLALATALISGWYTHSTFVIPLAAVLIGALLGFLPHNHHRASIFLGDSGSLMLGFLLSYLTLQSSKSADGSFIILVPTLALALPILDTLMAIIRRTKRHVHPFQADRAHIHHRLLNKFVNHKLAVHTLWTAALICQLLALSFFFLTEHIAVLLLAIALTALLFILRRVDYLRNVPCESLH